MADHLEQVTETEATLTNAATDVTGLTASDSQVKATVYTVINPSTTLTLHYRIASGAWIPIVASPDGNAYVTERAEYGQHINLGGDQNVEWKAASSTITAPIFTYMKIVS